jgi:predicted enzyme related to lactoylglutathione lyase
MPEADGGEPSTFSIEYVEGWKGGDWPEIWFESDRLDELVAELKTNGVAFESEPETMSYLWRVAHLRDPAGNRITLYHAGENRLYPPWRVK